MTEPTRKAVPTRPGLHERLKDTGFTPAVRDVIPLIDLLADEDYTKDAERALTRVGLPAVGLLVDRFSSARTPLRARIVKALGKFAQDERALAVIRTALTDSDPKARRNAAIALGHVHGDETEIALMSAWETDPRPEMRRSIAASLGKIGGTRCLALLHTAASADDPELVRIAERATMMVERTASRTDRGRIDPRRTPDAAVDVTVLSRRGLEELLAGELSRLAALEDVRVVHPGFVKGRLVGPMAELFHARTMLGFRFDLPSQSLRERTSPSDAIARALQSPQAHRVFTTWTEGPIRYRLAWAEGGHKRAATWDTAQAIGRTVPALVNDPTESTWEVVADARRDAVDVALVPRALDDPRFAWRRGDVPASSHPTVAAALARVAGAHADDVVWDPFAGSASELIERARIGPYRELMGTDTDPKAIAAASENLSAAGVRAHLEQIDALRYFPRGVTLVVTNPPMGRRASRTRGLADMLDAFVLHAGSLLEPTGRLVWITPWAARARATGPRAGFALDWAQTVDMGGFDAELQRWVRARGTPLT